MISYEKEAGLTKTKNAFFVKGGLLLGVVVFFPVGVGREEETKSVQLYVPGCTIPGLGKDYCKELLPQELELAFWFLPPWAHTKQPPPL